MRTEHFGAWDKDIKAYCVAHGLDYEKAKKMKPCWGIDFLKLKVNDESTAPVALLIFRNGDGSAICEQTEYTKKYLAQ